jgi:nucleoside-diphosphate-sugar epimerase
MRVFVTGATGFVGAAVVKELLAHDHQVFGLARSDRGEDELKKLGAKVIRGNLATPETLIEGAQLSDAIIHAGFVHDFSRFPQACAIDRAVIETLGGTIQNSQKPLVVTAGVAFLNAAGPVTVETDPAFPPSDDYPRASDAAARALCARGIPTGIMRLPPSVHGTGDHGFVPMLIDIARQKGFSAYIEEGANLWPAVHVQDAARAYRLAIERGPSADTYHAVAERGVQFRKIAEAIATGLNFPCRSLSVENAREHFDWFYDFASIDQPTSSNNTRAVLGWSPEGVDLLTDIRNAGYFAKVL